MIVRKSDSIDVAALDSALADAAYTPEEVVLLESALNDVCARAASHMPINDGVRSLLASAILEGALLGYRDCEMLSSFALRMLPAFRKDGAER